MAADRSRSAGDPARTGPYVGRQWALITAAGALQPKTVGAERIALNGPADLPGRRHRRRCTNHDGHRRRILVLSEGECSVCTRRPPGAGALLMRGGG